jgi:DNA topoisomerase I
VLAELGKGKSQSERKKNVVTAVRLVASELGNTPTICRKSYVHPVVVMKYLRGGTTITLPSHAKASANNGLGHAPEESALIEFLDEFFPERRKEQRVE